MQALRAFAYGLGSVLIGVTLARRALSGAEVGGVLGALLAGIGPMSFVLPRYGDRIGRRRAYVGLLAVMGPAGAVFAFTGWIPALVLAALTGTVSTDAVESGPITSLEQAMLPHATALDPTRLFGTYNTVATLAGALGALAAGGPTLLHTGSSRCSSPIPSRRRWRCRSLSGCRGQSSAGTSSMQHPPFIARAGSSTGWRRCSRSTRSAAASSSRNRALRDEADRPAGRSAP